MSLSSKRHRSLLKTLFAVTGKRWSIHDAWKLLPPAGLGIITGLDTVILETSTELTSTELWCVCVGKMFGFASDRRWVSSLKLHSTARKAWSIFREFENAKNE